MKQRCGLSQYRNETATDGHKCNMLFSYFTLIVVTNRQSEDGFALIFHYKVLTFSNSLFSI